jgi:hypothetical protein
MFTMKCCIGINCLEGPPALCFSGFSVTENNDYDFCARHSLAAEVACELGLTLHQTVEKLIEIESTPNVDAPNPLVLWMK